MGQPSSTVRLVAAVFLKYIVSHPAVTCAVPGMAKAEYVVDNVGAARGRLPDAAMRSAWSSLSMASDSGRAATKAKIYITTKHTKSTKEENIFLILFPLRIRSSCPSFAAHKAACLAGESPVTGIGCLPV